MPAPSTSLATQRPDLRDALEEFDLEANMRGMIARQVFPVINVAKQAGNLGRIKIGQLLMRRTTIRAPGSGYSRQQWEFEPYTYATEEHGAEEPIDDREAEMYSDYVDAELISTGRAMSAVMVNQEKRVAAEVFNTTTFTGAALTTAVGTAWTNRGTSDPITDVDNALKKVRANSGQRANTLIISWLRWLDLVHNDKILNRVKYQQQMDVRPGEITLPAMAAAINIPQILIGDSLENTANPGQTAVLADIWNPTMAMVCKTAQTMDHREPALGNIFHWSADGSEVEGMIETYREEATRSDVVRVRHDVDEVLKYKECGHLLTGVAT